MLALGLVLVDLGGEEIDVVEEGVVLLLGFDERVHNLLNICDPSLLLDLCERIIDDLHVPLVLIDDFDLLLVVENDLLETALQDLLGVEALHAGLGSL